MKTFNGRLVRITGLAMVVALIGMSNGAFSQSAGASKSFKAEKDVINRDLAKISQQQKKVNLLKEQCRAKDASAAEKQAVRIDLQKAQADLKHSKAYLQIHKSTLLSKHNDIIKEQRQALRQEQRSVTTARAKLFVDLIRGREEAVAHTRKVLDGKQDAKAIRAELQQGKVKRNNDLLAVNQSIREVNAQSPIVLVAENTLAKTQNLAMK